MTKKYHWLFTILMFLGVVLSACGGGNAGVMEPVAMENNAPANNAVEPAAPEVVEPEEVSLAALDTAFETFLGDMVAYNTISLDGLNAALAEDPPFLLDVRSPEEVEKSGHIEGSVLIPLRDLADNLAYLPSFDTPIVSYCGSGWRCTIALTVLEAMGWEDVKCLKGGSFSGWMEGGYAYVEGLQPEAEMLNAVQVDPALAAYFDEVLTNIPQGWGVTTTENLNLALVENADLVVIDARKPSEGAETGIVDAPNWINLPLEEFVASQDLLPEDLDTPIVIHCRSGHRSTIALTILWSYGYTNVTSLKGGFIAWEADGYPVVAFAAP